MLLATEQENARLRKILEYTRILANRYRKERNEARTSLKQYRQAAESTTSSTTTTTTVS